MFFRYLEKGCFSKYKGFLLKYEILWNMKSTEIPRCRDSESFLGWELGLEGCPSGEGVHSRGGVSGREVSPVGRSGIRYRRALCWDAPPVSGGGGVGGQVWGGRSSPIQMSRSSGGSSQEAAGPARQPAGPATPVTPATPARRRSN